MIGTRPPGQTAATPSTMLRVIPVMDLKAGQAVHAVRGQRQTYAPVQSVLVQSADPLALARALMDRLGARECYVADLDAIAGVGDHEPVIRAMASLGLDVWLDAGTATAADAERARGLGATRVIAGTETLRDPCELTAMTRVLEKSRATPTCVLSLDLRDGRLLGGSPEIERLGPGELTTMAWDAGIRTFIVLDLARVGSGEGPRLDTARALRRRFPAAELIIGGGVRNDTDLAALASQGFHGALVATALHRGIITSLTPESPR
jgi:phosphoribosylformimino-5-aminoimidazole carboxamide ribotide isomerase